MTVQHRRRCTQLLLRTASTNLGRLQQHGIRSGTRSSIGRLSSASSSLNASLGVRAISSTSQHSSLASSGVDYGQQPPRRSNIGKRYPSSSSSWCCNNGRRWQHTTPATSPASLTSGSSSSPSTSTNKGPSSSRHEKGEKFPAGIVAVEEGNHVLTLAVEEARCLLFALKQLQGDSSSTSSTTSGLSSSSTVLDGHRYQTEVEGAVKAAKALMILTQNKTNSLTSLIIKKRNDGENADVAPLHRAFLTVTQWCLNLAVRTNSVDGSGGHRNTSSSGGGLLLADNEMLDYALKLSTRAHELSLPFHLPLYRRLANTVAQQVSVDPLSWILRLSHWTEAEMGPVDAAFFSQPLLALCHRQRFVDATNLVKGMELEHNIRYVEAATTKEILFLVKDLIRPIWSHKNHRPPSRLEQDAVDLVLMLESSIWKIFDYPPFLEEEDDFIHSNLREAFEAIVSTEEDARMAYSNLEQILAATEESLLDDSEEEDYDDDDNDDDDEDDEENDELDLLPPPPRRGSHPRDRNTWNTSRQSAHGIGRKLLSKSDFTVEILPSGKHTHLNLSSNRVEREELVEEELSQPLKMLYTRQEGYRDIPDLAAQLQEMNKGAPLLYSKEFERQLFHQIYPPTMLDDDDDDVYDDDVDDDDDDDDDDDTDLEQS